MRILISSRSVWPLSSACLWAVSIDITISPNCRMGISSPGICCDIDRTSVARSSSLHSLFSFLMKSSSQSSREASMLPYLFTLLTQGSLVL
uniref:Secreted protein n=1 Tax=Arundo donax TaxID=35708 RepID=A0A0A9CN85_ARUDO